MDKHKKEEEAKPFHYFGFKQYQVAVNKFVLLSREMKKGQVVG